MLWGIDEGVIFTIAVVAFLAAMEVAFRLGRRHSAESKALLQEEVNAINTTYASIRSLSMTAFRSGCRKHSSAMGPSPASSPIPPGSNTAAPCAARRTCRSTAITGAA